MQTYSKEAVEHVQEALTQAQRTKSLDQNIFKVICILWYSVCVLLVISLLFVFQNYSPEALEHVQEALTLAQRTKKLTPRVFEVKNGDWNVIMA